MEADPGRIQPHGTSQQPSTSLADLVGQLGRYQLSLTVLAFVRYLCCAMMTNTEPLIAPDVDFRCQPRSSADLIVPSSSWSSPANISSSSSSNSASLLNNCHVNVSSGGRIHECNEWKFDSTTYGVTLTDSFDLVCEREYLRSTFQSLVTVGVTLSAIFWGIMSDKYGRLSSIRAAYVCSLLSGGLSCWAPNYWIYTLSRCLCSFSDAGLAFTLTVTMVETLGNKYRGSACIWVYTGWSMGVMVMPFLTDFFRDFRLLMVFTVACHLITLPWMLTVGESVRWLMVNERYEEARAEIERILHWNEEGPEKFKEIEAFDKRFDNFRQKFLLLNEHKKKQPSETMLSSINSLFHSRQVTSSMLTMIWVGFNAELFYMFFILISSDVGDSVKLNYFVGGIMELIATLISIIIIANTGRGLSLITTMLTLAGLCATFSQTHQHALASVWVLNLSKLASSTLTSIVYVANNEIFPTNLRQTGFGVVGTFSSLGGVVAPFIQHELVKMFGMSHVVLFLSAMPVTASILIPFFLRETKDVELPDDLTELENT